LTAAGQSAAAVTRQTPRADDSSPESTDVDDAFPVTVTTQADNVFPGTAWPTQVDITHTATAADFF
jgi:hypothetical protein